MALPILDGNQSATTLSTVLTSGEHIPAHTVVSLGSAAISNITSAVSGSVVSVSNFPSTQTIAGTVTANVFGFSESNSSYFPIPIVPNDEAVSGYQVAVKIKQTGEEAVPISGTVTASVPILTVATHGASPLPSPIQTAIGVFNTNNPNQILGVFGAEESEGEGISAFVSVRNPISGTVTVGTLPSGALTTRFGSVVTANLSFITSAVTNTSRKYLLAQNISAGTVTIGIGFSPTTTQGIQLTAGGGLTFDAFCPTGAVYWLGAVTGANYCLIEG